MTDSGESDKIKHKENEDFVFEDAKITGFMLKSGSKHYKEFADVGYSPDNPQRLYDDITNAFDSKKLIDNGLNNGGNPSFYMFAELGVIEKKRFLLAFQEINGDLQFVSAYRKDGKKE